MSKKKDCRDGPPKITRDEIDLFRNTLNNTKPIKSQKSQKNPPFRKKLTAKASFTKKDNQNVLTESLNVDIDLQEENNSDILRFHRSNITPKIMKKLSRGTFSVQSELDLHGMTSNEASLVLKLFISESVQDGLTCVRVIHGKGLGSGPRGPVIKQQVNRE